MAHVIQTRAQLKGSGEIVRLIVNIDSKVTVSESQIIKTEIIAIIRDKFAIQEVMVVFEPTA